MPRISVYRERREIARRSSRLGLDAQPAGGILSSRHEKKGGEKRDRSLVVEAILEYLNREEGK